jgi:hypothetical protein
MGAPLYSAIPARTPQQASGDCLGSAFCDFKKLSTATLLGQLPFPLIETLEQVDA